MRGAFILTALSVAPLALAMDYYPFNPPNLPVRLDIASSSTFTTSTTTATGAKTTTCTARTKHYPYKCNVTGTLTNPSPSTDVMPVLTVDDCRNLCESNNTCVVFGFQDSTSSCFITPHASLYDQGYKSGPGDIFYWNRNCFACTTASAPPTPTNVVMNGDFGTGDLTDWSVTGPSVKPAAVDGTTSGVSSPGADNSTYAYFGNIPVAGDLIFLSQPIGTIENITYTVNFDFMVNNTGVQNGLYVVAGNDDQTGKYRFYISPNTFTPGTWQSGAGSYKAQANDTFGFIFSASKNQTYYIDNVEVLEVY